MSVLLGGSSGDLPHVVVPIEEASRIGEARRRIREVVEMLGFDDVAAGRIALTVNELGTNLVRHATGGRLCFAVRDRDRAPCLEIVAMDDGPGMADPMQCMTDGYSTAGTLGQGLGAVRRLADDFDIFSAIGQGTLVLARFRLRADGGPGDGLARARSGFEMGVMCVAAPGEQVSGDAWALALDGDRATAMVADGLGHGVGAAEAGAMAQQVFAGCHGAVLTQILERAHAAMRGTRGAAVTLARLDAGGGAISLLGAGNVACRVISGLEDKSAQVQNGTVGVQIRSPREQAIAWSQHAVFVLFSDGLHSRWQLDAALLRCDVALIAAYLVCRFSRGRDDVTVMVLRRAEETR